MRIASLTKIMTAIVAIEHGDLSDIVKTSRRAAGKEGSSIYLRVGDEMSLHHLLYGLMLRSGNDAAVAIAEHVGGSEEGFVHLMNEKARELGLTNTHFMNPHGLDHDDHYSSANDLARLTAYALRNPVFREIVKTRVKKVPNPNAEWDHVWTNKNKMLLMYEGADGVKTGYTKLARRCLVSSATRNGQQLAAVTLNDGDDWADHRKLLDWGFQHYPLKTIAEEGRKIAGYSLAVGRTFRYPLAEGERERISTRLLVRPQDDVRTRLGDVGRLEFRMDGEPIGSVPLKLLEPPEGGERKAKRSAVRETGAAPDAAEPRDGRSLPAALRTVVIALLARGV
jgi:D-alanyl-D-alanine carboxypeptidase